MMFGSNQSQSNGIKDLRFGLSSYNLKVLSDNSRLVFALTTDKFKRKLKILEQIF
jgi:hypothetical protein